MTINYKKLLQKAIEASEKAYCPYSHFPVGAALMADNEEETLFLGCNVENSSYSMCLCAERTAVGQAVSSGYQKFKAIAIVAKNLRPCNPCGACLQVLTEFSPEIEIILQNQDGSPIVKRLIDFLPNMFTPDSLKENSSLFIDKD